jgi:hypothetical protein
MLFKNWLFHVIFCPESRKTDEALALKQAVAPAKAGQTNGRPRELISGDANLE